MEAKRIWTRPGNGRLRHFVFVRFLASTNCQRIGPGGEFSLFYHLFITVHWLLLLWKDIEVNLAIIIVSLKQFLLYSQKSKQRWFCLFFFFFFSIFVWREKKERRNLQHMITYQPLPVCYMKSCVLKPINRDDMCQQTLLKWKNILINKEY